MTTRVFISYAQESAAHRLQVRRLWELLRRCGIDAKLDLAANNQRLDWTLWMADQIREADHVLCVASAAYRRRAEGREGEGQGRGVQWEARLIRAAVHEDPALVGRFLPVVLPGESAAGIPDFLSPYGSTTYHVADFTVSGAESLLRLLLDQPEVVELPLPPPYVFPAADSATQLSADPRTSGHDPMVGDPNRHTAAMADLVRHYRVMHTGRVRDLGSDHPDTLAAAHALAYWIGQSGRYGEAIRQFAEVERLRAATLGADAPLTLRSRLNRVVMSGWADSSYPSVSELERLLGDHIRVMGLGNRQSLRVWWQFVSHLKATDRPAETLHQFDDIVAECSRVLGRDDIDTCRVRVNQAWLRYRVDAIDGLRAMRKLLDEVREQLGPDHSTTILLGIDVARATCLSGEEQEGLRLAQLVCADAERTLGKRSPVTMIVREGTASVASRAKEHRETLERYEELYRDQAAVLGKAHRDTLKTAFELACCARNFDSPKVVLGKLQAVLDLTARALPVDDPDVLSVRGEVAWETARTGNHAESGRLYDALIRDCARVLGPDAPATFDERQNHATTLGLGGDPASALVKLRALREDVARVRGPDSQRTRRIDEAVAGWSAELAQPKRG